MRLVLSRTVRKGDWLENAKASLDYAFKYFDLHAKQRMTVFNFFLAISGALIGLIAASLGGDSKYPLAALSLSTFLLALSYLFWQLDIRTSFLIKHAETSLEISEKVLFESHARLVGTEKDAFEAFRNDSFSLSKGLSYSRSLHLIFAFTALLAAVGIVISLGEIFNYDLINIVKRLTTLCQNL